MGGDSATAVTKWTFGPTVRTLAVLLALTSLVIGGLPSHAYGHHDPSHTAHASYWNSNNAANPYMVFTKQATTDSTLTAYVSFPDGRYRVQMRAGSGTGTNECVRNVGWLPDGTYSSIVYYADKTWGDTTVRGSVWYLGDKPCHNGTPRTELFIHSSGGNDEAWTGNYSSNGCIKVSQLDRYSASGASLRTYLRAAYNRNSETLTVTD